MIADACDAVGDYYTRKPCAILERRTIDACDTVRDCYTCKSCAILERRTTDACDTVGYSYASKSLTTVERRIADACNSIPCYIILEHSGNNKIFIVSSCVANHCSVSFGNLKINRNDRYSI